MMIGILILSLCLAGLFKSARDLMTFKPERSIFGAESDPRKSWLRNEHKHPQWLWDGPLAFLGDPWHFVESLLLSTYELLIASGTVYIQGWPWWSVVVVFLAMKGIRGGAFELGWQRLFYPGPEIQAKGMVEDMGRMIANESLKAFSRAIAIVWGLGFALIFAGLALNYGTLGEWGMREEMTPGAWLIVAGVGAWIIVALIQIIKGKR